MAPTNRLNIQAVVFDLSGTVIDFGSRGPVVAFMELFARHGVTVSAAAARGPMGTHKRDHIWAMLTDPDLSSQWEKAHGQRPNQQILDRLCAELTPLQVEVLKRHCDVIPGVPDVVQELRRRRIKIASTTGFEMPMMENLIPDARAGGYSPDLFVTPDLVGKGRPAPWMAFYAARQLDVYPMQTFVKVGDTPADVAEAHAAGMWAVSVISSGNEVGLSQEELDSLSASERQAVLRAARARLSACGPHFIIDTAADLIPVIDEVNARLARGERP